jgi:two-component system response regulator FlrC
VQALMRHDWPGNVRELANAIERAVILTRTGRLDLEMFPLGRAGLARPTAPAATSAPAAARTAVVVPPFAGPEAPFDLRELERIAIERALAATGGHRTRAAELLGISERTLRNKLNTPVTVE